MRNNADVITAFEGFVCNFTPCCTSDEYHFELFKKVLELLKEQETMMQCIKGKCRICPHCANCDVDENGLIKEQEAVEPKVIRMNEFGYPVHACGKCGLLITESMNYCHECGKRIKWEGR